MDLNTIENRINKNYWSVNIGIARSFLALCTLSTLAFNPVGTLFVEGKGSGMLGSYNLFTMFDNFYLSKIIGIIILLIVISGYFPRFTCIPHLWVALSFSTTSIVIEGGDQITSIMCLLLIPVLLLDKRINHYKFQKTSNSYYANCISYFTLLLISLQAAFVYFQASLAKVNVEEWANGTAVYYWLNDSVFGFNDSFIDYVNWALKSPVLTTLLTWGAMGIELFIAFTVFSNDKKLKKYAFIAGLSLHFFIAVAFGLISFFFAMTGVLILYLLPYGNMLKSLKKLRYTRPDYVQNQI